MSGNRTYTMIKPTAMRKGFMAAIMNKIAEGGFKIVAAKMTKLSKAEAEEFYAIHRGRPFFEDLTTFMSSGPIMAMVVEKENAVEAYRNYIGATNPADAAEGTIRKLYGTNIGENAVHGSDSDENAANEIHFFFSDRELVG
ncbi:MAG: nucleoside-diphosphate kinase [Bacteroidales bacterium]|nr:nucleoside-diphosphate kinase [Bacteroidales bacterium]